MKKILTRQVWSKGEYYDTAREGSMDFTHLGMKELLKLAPDAESILDMGCGEGTRLNTVIGRNKAGYGIDISSKAILIAQKRYPRLKFVLGDLEKLPFADSTFDLVYSAFVFEHLDRPGQVIKEAIRVLKPGGNLLVVAPNYGAPSRASPPFVGSRIVKLITGFILDFIRPSADSLHWKKVTPIANADVYKTDWDTTVEPYLGSLISFVRRLGLKIVKKLSCWEEEEEGASTPQKLFRIFGEWGVYPFSNWGPHLVLLAEK